MKGMFTGNVSNALKIGARKKKKNIGARRCEL
jgi:hypothetical protein